MLGSTREYGPRRGEEETMRKPKRDVLGYIDRAIEFQRGSSTDAPPGGYASGIDKAEAELVEITVRKTLAAVGFPLKPEWFPANAYQEQRLTDAYRNRGLDATPLQI
jgi:hypothetical protein